MDPGSRSRSSLVRDDSGEISDSNFKQPSRYKMLAAHPVASWFETRGSAALLTMRV
jgi:hypothetical protein